MKYKLLFISLLLTVTSANAAKPKVIQGDFDVLKNERFVGTIVDFSKAKFDGRDLESHLYSHNISETEWHSLELEYTTACTIAFSYESWNKQTTLGLKDLKNTKYYLVIYPLDIAMNDGECNVEIHLIECATNSIIAIAIAHAEAVDPAFINPSGWAKKNVLNWETNLYHAMWSIGRNALDKLIK